MKSFLDQDFLLQTDTARELYHEHAAKMPIIDYHCHLDPRQIAENHQFEDLTEIWLGGDHYKWRAMRANGIPEEYITGDKSPYEKFLKWAETMPYTMRNPLYHWTHLELSRIFGIHKVLNPASAKEIYTTCTDKLRTPEYRAQAIMKRMNVEIVCTTDDPIDSLEYHQKYVQTDATLVYIRHGDRTRYSLSIISRRLMTICPSWRRLPIRPSSPTSIYWRLYKNDMISSPPKGAGYRTTGWILSMPNLIPSRRLR